VCVKHVCVNVYEASDSDATEYQFQYIECV